MKKKNRDVIYFSDSYDLHEFLMEKMEDTEEPWITVITSSDTAKDLMYYCMECDYKVEYVDINDWEYDDLYIVSIDNEAVSVEPANRKGTYLWSDGEIFVDCSLEQSDAYIKAMIDRFGDDFEATYVCVGEYEYGKVFEYENSYEDDKTYASISVSSNVKDYVDVVREFFEDYFCN